MTDRIRRVVTAHDEKGVAIILSDQKVALPPFPGADAKGAVVWTTGSIPADNVDDVKGDGRDAGMSLKCGSVLRVTEFGPGFASPMHRTLSIDYVVVVSGELEMELDSGEVVRLEPGEIVIQRGGKHVWRNPSPNIACRIMVCMSEAQPITINGKTLGPTPTWMMVVSSLWALLTRNRRGNVTQASETTTRRSLPGSVRRIVTTHDKAGNTAVLSAQEMPLPAWPGADAAEPSFGALETSQHATPIAISRVTKGMSG
jgi:mannose-6-phosphate isomerase-like protein (cupin superfamily)